MAKNNIGLVEYVKAQLGRPYWFGTFGQIGNSKLWAEKAKQYPRYYSNARKDKMKARGDEGKKVHDCAGLWKGYMMSTGPDMPAQYDKTYDLSADVLYSKAEKKGPIDTMPDIPGIGLHKKGHFGVYIGGGREIEARGFDYGVLEDDVRAAGFTEWFYIPFIEYVSQDQQQEPAVSDKKDLDTIVDEVIAGDWGNGQERIDRLTAAGYDAAAVQTAVNAKLGTGAGNAAPTWLGIVNTRKDPLRVRSNRGLNYPVIKLLPKGSMVELVGDQVDGWYKMADGSGWVSAQYIGR